MLLSQQREEQSILMHGKCPWCCQRAKGCKNMYWAQSLDAWLLLECHTVAILLPFPLAPKIENLALLFLILSPDRFNSSFSYEVPSASKKSCGRKSTTSTMVCSAFTLPLEEAESSLSRLVLLWLLIALLRWCDTASETETDLGRALLDVAIWGAYHHVTLLWRASNGAILLLEKNSFGEDHQQ